MVDIVVPRLSLFKHQLIGSMWMKEHEIWDCEGDWNADERDNEKALKSWQLFG